jgi:hypothetical protein
MECELPAGCTSFTFGFCKLFLQGIATLRFRARVIIRQTCGELGVMIVKGVLARDHVHMFPSAPPKYPHLRCDAPAQRTLAATVAAGVSSAQKTLMGTAFLGTRGLSHNER